MESLLDALFTTLEQRDRLSHREKDALSKLSWSTNVVAASGDIVPEHSRMTRSCLLLEGFAARCLSTAAGDRQIAAVHVPGNFVDLHGFLLKSLNHSIVALTDCKLAHVSHSELRGLTETMPHLGRLLMTMVAIDSAIQSNWILMLGRKHADSRLANLLCELCLRLEAVGLADERTFRFPVSQAAVADMLGLSTVHTNRILMSMKTTGLVEWQSGKVRITDWEALCLLAEFSPFYLEMNRKPR